MTAIDVFGGDPAQEAYDIGLAQEAYNAVVEATQQVLVKSRRTLVECEALMIEHDPSTAHEWEQRRRASFAGQMDLIEFITQCQEALGDLGLFEC